MRKGRVYTQVPECCMDCVALQQKLLHKGRADIAGTSCNTNPAAPVLHCDYSLFFRRKKKPSTQKGWMVVDFWSFTCVTFVYITWVVPFSCSLGSTHDSAPSWYNHKKEMDDGTDKLGVSD